MTSENMDEAAPADSDAGYIPELPSDDMNVSDDTDTDSAADTAPSEENSGKADEPDSSESTDSSMGDTPDSGTDIDPITPDEEQPLPDDEQLPSDEEIVTPEESSNKPLFQDGKILIYTCDQLKEIGSGNTVTDEDGTDITYASDAQYAIAEDIELTGDMLQWQLPDDFTGSITPLTEASDNLTLYDAQSDTIYLYNPYQMAVLHEESPDTEPVMDGDAQAETFGCGQLIYPNGEDNAYLTYSLNHRYVLSKQFSSDVSVQPYSVTVKEGKADGRDFPGQVIKELGGKTYILIGNEQQLRKIGVKQSNGEYYPVRGAAYQAYRESAFHSWKLDTDAKGKYILLYGGDADLSATDNGIRDFTFGTALSASKSFSGLGHNYDREPCGVNQTTGEIDPYLNINKVTNQTYAPNANYIIFRDIDLSSRNWTPLTFQGTMIGAKLDANAATDACLWNDTEITATGKPVISNVTVDQSSRINVGEQMGVGFFSTISSEVSEKDIGLSKGLVQVSNLKFQNISVQTTTSETYYPDTLVSTLTSTLGKLLGGLLSGLTFILTFGQVKVDLGKTLGDVLDARKKDPTALATGVIAGRVEGQVEFSGIEVAGATVKNVNNNTGGFVGYTVGVTQYDGLSKALGKIVELLTNILNVIPGLGLGDLITILLGNAIPLEKLIPTGYINAKFVDCSINNLNLTTASDKDYAGGFVGQQVGSIFENCSITGSSYTVNGANYVGGFAGIARDGVINGTLSGALDIQTKLPKMNTESLLLNCTLENATISVNGGNYVGGFAGAFANTSAVNCTLTTTEPLTVHSTGSNVGGFAGITTLGWAANLGKSDTKDNLLGGLVDLVVQLLSSNPGAASSLLSLAGVNPSYILGCAINAPLTVIGTNYAGGITGRGDGAYIAPSSADYLSKVSYWRNGVYDPATVEQRNTTVSGLQSVSGHDYTGGIAGSLGTASVGGLLNNTAGIASYLGFTVDGVTVTGSDNGLTVDGWERVSGGLGDAIGGTINNVSVNRGTDAMLVNVPKNGAKTEAAIKSTYPTVEKKVKNSTDGEFKPNGTAQVGEKVTFQLTAEVPDMSDYTKYTFKFVDTMTKGLDFAGTDSVTVKIDDKVISKDASAYTATYTAESKTLTIGFDDLKTVNKEGSTPVATGDKIVVTYEAYINKDASHTDPATNKVHLEYSNNPNGSGKGESTPSESKVYTYEIKIDKFYKDNETNKPLAGATFTLTTSETDSTNGIDLINDDAAEGTTGLVYHVKGHDETGTSTKVVTTDATGKITIKGLKEGTYYLHETAAPTGFNKLTHPIKIEITADTSDLSQFTYKVNGTDNTKNDTTIKVENVKGVMLPETGSIGTIGLTVLGVAVVLLGVFAPRKKKKENQ